jgi:hypothetical protein
MEHGMSSTIKHVDVVYFDAGSGHRSSARGLAAALTTLRPHWQVNVVNIVDIFAYNKRFHWIVQTGINHFNNQLKHERLFDLRGLINLSLLCHDLVTQPGIEQIARYWADRSPDAIVSVTPMYNPVLYRAAQIANPNVVCITIPVDFEEVRSRYWFTPKIEQHYLVASDRLLEQARKTRIPDAFLHPLPGMIIDPAFYCDPPQNIPHEIERLGLDPKLPTGVVSFGGQGSVVVREITKQIALSDLKVNMIFLCGRNTAIYDEVRNLPTPYPKLVLAYAEEPPHYYHHIADFVIGKPGTMTLTESLITCKPFIFIKSRGMAPVQRGNESWVIDHDTGVMANGVKRIVPAIEQVLSSPVYRENAEKYRHEGVFSAADSVCTLLERP